MAGIKRKAEMEIPITDENDLLKITPLGAGNEVGRSSILLEYKGKTILVCFDNYFQWTHGFNIITMTIA
jgi:cleavage and polyadenylation specificity factor subunit 3